ncbi:circularly permuted type 2 ATP-grasp protein [Polluticaenibacter yanchengensis]|uniref:Circularly permuted type 2 ATP-grasp protein n=1 Tax=Polluticaenibacter yanchengensis TaxID=3014562 RepID=A0ABT4UNG2_9BACT|nr:circularly permuted type 2 ATP-grasp protein [Chitinophagaceae bacterium LY-5]
MRTVYPIETLTGWDEMFTAEGVRERYNRIMATLENLTIEDLKLKHVQASDFFMNNGITFTVYSDNEGIERIFPFDIIPRIITREEWQHIEAGIKQRLTALNRFLKDVYHDQQIIKDGIIPGELIESCPHFLKEMIGVNVPHDVYVHISGIDLIRGADGVFYILEDNLRTPSGVSYMLENREVTKRILPESLYQNKVNGVSHYPLFLQQIMQDMSDKEAPTMVVLTPGVYNSAYYEHTFLAKQMGVPLVEGRDLVVQNDMVYMKTTGGLEQVDVIYRRIDDEFIDPLVFRSDSMLGVPGIMQAYKKGNVCLVNAVGNGVADDKAVYVYVPDMIRYYLNEEPILPNVPTYRLENEGDRLYVFENIRKMVVKETNQSGGYGMLMGPSATDEEVEKCIAAVKKSPRSFIAQPVITLSTVPCLIDGKLQPRHVDLRPYALCGANGDIKIVPGGLTRVALKEGSLVVNSSQGGGSKDTWVID